MVSPSKPPGKKTSPSTLATEKVTIGPPTEMPSGAEIAAMAEAAAIAIDFKARQDAIGLKRRKGGPAIDELPKTKAKPNDVPATEIDSKTE